LNTLSWGMQCTITRQSVPFGRFWLEAVEMATAHSTVPSVPGNTAGIPILRRSPLLHHGRIWAGFPEHGGHYSPPAPDGLRSAVPFPRPALRDIHVHQLSLVWMDRGPNTPQLALNSRYSRVMHLAFRMSVGSIPMHPPVQHTDFRAAVIATFAFIPKPLW
jgi:hypothetical protein